MKKWTITLEWVRGNWVILITHGRGPICGTATADDLETAMSMAAELFEGCLEWPEVAAEKDQIALVPNTPVSQPAPDEGRKKMSELDMLLECQRLIIHMRIHSGYSQQGYEKMTGEQQRLYDALWQESEDILEGAPMKTIAPARCSECGQLLPVAPSATPANQQEEK
jgi:hypothetical protein